MTTPDPLIPLPGLALPLSQLKAIVAQAEKPQPPPFKVGDWVTGTQYDSWQGRAYRVTATSANETTILYEGYSLAYAHHWLRLATPDEIAAAPPQPVEGQVYRHHRTTNADPYACGSCNLRRYYSGRWWYRSRRDTDWLEANEIGRNMWERNELVPYTPPRIVPQVGTLLRRKADQAVLAVTQIEPTHIYLVNLTPPLGNRPVAQHDTLTPDAYTVLDSYTVVGAKP